MVKIDEDVVGLPCSVESLGYSENPIESILAYFEKYIRPKIRVDGGDMVLQSVGSEVYRLVVHADCATCPAAENCIAWVKQELEQQAECCMQFNIVKEIPYYAK